MYAVFFQVMYSLLSLLVQRIENFRAYTLLMYLDAVCILPGELEDWVWCQVVRHFFYNLWCLTVNVFLTCDASRGLWHHPVTTDMPSLDDFNKNEKLLAVYSEEDASSLWWFVVKMSVQLGGEEDFACDATVAPSLLTPVAYKTYNHITTFLFFCWE